jgi:hypothetical protein
MMKKPTCKELEQEESECKRAYEALKESEERLEANNKRYSKIKSFLAFVFLQNIQNVLNNILKMC